MKPVEVTVTCGSAEEASRIAEAVVERRLAACAQSWPVSSCYRWLGEVVTEGEHLLMMKSLDVRFEELAGAIQELHSYELPAIVMIPLEGHGPGYLDWLVEEAGPDGHPGQR